MAGWFSDFSLSWTYTWDQNIIHASPYLLWIPHLGSSVRIMFDWHDRKTFIRSFVSRIIDAIIWISEFNNYLSWILKADNWTNFFLFRDYSDYSFEGILANICGACIIIFVSLIIYAGTNSNYRRIEKSEEQLLLGDKNIEWVELNVFQYSICNY